MLSQDQLGKLSDEQLQSLYAVGGDITKLPDDQLTSIYNTVQRPADQGFIGNVGSFAKKGLGEGIAGLGHLFGSNDVKHYGEEVANNADKNLSQAALDEQAKQFMVPDEDGGYKYGGAGLKSLAYKIAPAAPIIATDVAAGIGAGALATAAAPAGATAGAVALGVAAARMLAGAGVNGLVMAGMDSNATDKFINDTAKNNPDVLWNSELGKAALENAGGNKELATLALSRDLSNQVAMESGALNAGIGLAGGAVGMRAMGQFSKLGAAEKVAEIAAKNPGREFAKNMAHSAGVGGAQMVGEAAIHNAAEGAIDPRALQDYGSAFTEGAAVGAGMGLGPSYLGKRRMQAQKESAQAAIDAPFVDEQLYGALKQLEPLPPEQQLQLADRTNIDTPVGSMSMSRYDRYLTDKYPQLGTLPSTDLLGRIEIGNRLERERQRTIQDWRDAGEQQQAIYDLDAFKAKQEADRAAELNAKNAGWQKLVGKKSEEASDLRDKFTALGSPLGNDLRPGAPRAEDVYHRFILDPEFTAPTDPNGKPLRGKKKALSGGTLVEYVGEADHPDFSIVKMVNKETGDVGEAVVKNDRLKVQELRGSPRVTADQYEFRGTSRMGEAPNGVGLENPGVRRGTDQVAGRDSSGLQGDVIPPEAKPTDGTPSPRGPVVDGEQTYPGLADRSQEPVPADIARPGFADTYETKPKAYPSYETLNAQETLDAARAAITPKDDRSGTQKTMDAAKETRPASEPLDPFNAAIERYIDGARSRTSLSVPAIQTYLKGLNLPSHISLVKEALDTYVGRNSPQGWVLAKDSSGSYTKRGGPEKKFSARVDEAPKEEPVTGEQPQTDRDKALSTVKRYIDQFRARGKQGRVLAASLDNMVRKSGASAEQMAHAFEMADIVSRVLPSDGAHVVSFIKGLIEGDKEGGYLNGLIELSMDKAALGMSRETAYHESFHALQDYFKNADPGAKAIIDRAFAGVKSMKDVPAEIQRALQAIQSAYPGKDGQPESVWNRILRTEAKEINPSEAQAHVFGPLADAMRFGKQIKISTPAYRRFINFLSKTLDSIGNFLRGEGYRTAEDVLKQYARGGAEGFAKEAFDPSSSAQYSTRIRHSSPASFKPEDGAPHGRFSDKHMGNGEGAQAYGWGHYGEEDQGVFRHYQKQFGNRASRGAAPGVWVGGYEHGQRVTNPESAKNMLWSKFKFDNPLQSEGMGLREQKELFDHTWDLYSGMGYSSRSALPETRLHGEKVLRWLDREAPPAAHAYDVEFNADRGIDLLDWDKKFKDQPEAVQKAVKEAMHTETPESTVSEIERIQAMLLEPIRFAKSEKTSQRRAAHLQAVERLDEVKRLVKAGDYDGADRALEQSIFDEWTDRFSSEVGGLYSRLRALDRGNDISNMTGAEVYNMLRDHAADLQGGVGDWKAGQELDHNNIMHADKAVSKFLREQGVKGINHLNGFWRNKAPSSGTIKVLRNAVARAQERLDRLRAGEPISGDMHHADTLAEGIASAEMELSRQQRLLKEAESFDKRAKHNYIAFDPKDLEIVRKYSSRVGMEPQEFSRWWGNSEAVDRNGDPQMYLHATTKAFKDNEFKKAKSGNHELGDGPFFFITDNAFADDFSRLDLSKGGNHGKESQTGVQYPVYLSVQNPFDGHNPDHVEALKAALAKSFTRDDLVRENRELRKINETNPENVDRKIKLMGGLDRMIKDEIEWTGEDMYGDHSNWNAMERPSVQRAIREMGHDGFYVLENGAKNLAVYDPRQIKSIFNQFEPGTAESKKFSARMKPVDTDSAEFKRWFGDSKVVDADGKPLRVYHGTNEAFEEFKRTKTGLPNDHETAGFYFTPDPRYSHIGSEAGGEGHNALPVHIRMDNPYYTESQSFIEGLNAWRDNQDVVADLRAKGYDGVIYAKKGDITKGPTGWGDDHPQYFVFDPTQIKSAVSNTGEFSRTDPRIQYSSRARGDAATEHFISNVFADEPKQGWNRVKEIVDGWRGDGFKNAAKWAYQKIIDSHHGIANNEVKRYGHLLVANMSAYKAAIMADRASSFTANAIKMGGIPVMKDGGVKIETLNDGGLWNTPAMKKVREADAWQLFQAYGVDRRNASIGARDPSKISFKELYKATGTKPGDEAAKLEASHPYIKEAFEDMVRYNDKLVDFLVDSDVISKDQGARFKKDGDYISFYRKVEKALEGVGDYSPIGGKNLVSRADFKKLKGGEDKIGSFFENYARNMSYALDAGLRNVAAKRAMDTAVEIDAAIKIDGVPEGRAKRRGDIVGIKKGGETEWYKVEDKLLLDSLTSMDADPLPGILKALRIPAKLLRNMTTHHPGFLLSHMLRESMQSWSVYNRGTTIPIWSGVEGWRNVIKGAESTKQMKQLGLEPGFDYSSSEDSGKNLKRSLQAVTDPQGFNNMIAKKLMDAWHGYEKYIEAADLGTRDTIFRKEMESHGNEFEAAYQALSNAVNFTRSGSSSTMRILAGLVPFMNARVQGADVVTRAIVRDRPWGKGSLMPDANGNMVAVKGASSWAKSALMLALSGALYAAMKDTKEYKNLPEEERDMNWVFRLADGLIMKIPIPFEAGLIGKYSIERILRGIDGSDLPEDSKKAFFKGVYDILRLDPVPQAIKPMVDIGANRRSLSGSPIETRVMQGKPKEDRYDSTTSLTARGIGSLTHQSPAQVDYLLKGYLGTVGSSALALTDFVARNAFGVDKAGAVPLTVNDLPVISRVFKDTNMSASPHIEHFFELKTKAHQMQTAIDDYIKAGQPEKAKEVAARHPNLLRIKPSLDAINLEMSRLVKAEGTLRALPEKAISAEDRQQKLRNIRAARNLLVENINQLRRMAD